MTQAIRLKLSYDCARCLDLGNYISQTDVVHHDSTLLAEAIMWLLR